MAWSQIANLKGADGAAGPPPQIRVDSGKIQWRAGAEDTWKDLITVAELRGADGEDGTGVTILGSYPDAAALIAAHPTGAPGEAYLVDGDLYVWSESESEWTSVGTIQGPAGSNIELQVSASHIQWRVAGQGAPWQDLINLDELEGPTGPRGTKWHHGAGAPGTLPDQQVGDFYLDTQTGTIYGLD